MPALWLTALHAGGTGLAPEMPHREKLLAELGGLIWGFGWWENGHCRCGSYRVAGTTPGCAAGYHSRQRYPRHFLEAPLRLASGLRAYLHDESRRLGWCALKAGIMDHSQVLPHSQVCPACPCGDSLPGPLPVRNVHENCPT